MDPLAPSGLFSYGLRLRIDPAAVVASASEPVQLPPALNHNGVAGAGAVQMIGSDWVGVKGTVDITALPIEFYGEAILATFLLTDQSGIVGGSYELRLDFFNTLGPTESIFVDGEGNTLDDRITFGSAIVNIIPEPATLHLGAFALAVFVGGWRWMRSQGVRRSLPRRES